MTRLFLLVLLFGVIQCRFRRTERWRRHRPLTAIGPRPMPWMYSSGYSEEDEEDSKEDFDDLFHDVIELFIEADAARRQYGIKDNNAVDLYTPEGYKRIYPFEDCDEHSLEIKIKNRVMKIRARCQPPVCKLKDIVVLPDNLQTKLLTYHVDRITSKLIINVPFVKYSVNVDSDEYYPRVDMVPYLR